MPKPMDKGVETKTTISEEMYTKGNYLEYDPTWHIEDSVRKSEEIIKIMSQNDIQPKSICEVGCGGGEILRQLQFKMSD